MLNRPQLSLRSWITRRGIHTRLRTIPNRFDCNINQLRKIELEIPHSQVFGVIWPESKILDQIAVKRYIGLKQETISCVMKELIFRHMFFFVPILANALLEHCHARCASPEWSYFCFNKTGNVMVCMEREDLRGYSQSLVTHVVMVGNLNCEDINGRISETCLNNVVCYLAKGGGKPLKKMHSRARKNKYPSSRETKYK